MSGAEEKPNFTGKYKHVKSENFEEFLQANGAPWIARKMAARANPNLEVIQDGDNFVLRLSGMIFTTESKFTVGQEFEEKQHSGVVMKVMPKWESNKLVLSFTPKEGDTSTKPHKTTRELKDNQLVMTMEIDDVKCTKIFEKQTA